MDKKTANRNKCGSLSHIENGAIDFYCGLKMETKLSFGELCDNIGKRIDESFLKHNNHVKAFFQKDIEEFIRENGLENKICIRDFDKVKIKAKFDEFSNSKDDICNIDLNVTDNGYKITPLTCVEYYLLQMLDESNSDYDFSKRIYGDTYVKSQARFTLPPMKVELKNSSVILLNAMLFVFKNNAAVLRMTLPIDKMDTEPLMQNEIDDYIVSMKTLYDFPLQLENNSIQAAEACYCQFLAGTHKVKAVVCFKKIVNVILANHSGMFDDVKNIPNGIKEDIYKISVAPLQERKGMSYEEDAIIHFEKNGYFFGGIGYILSSMGKCVSVVDNSVLEFAKEIYDKNVIYSKIINDIRRNVEFTIIILLLKNINNSYTFDQNGFSNSKLSKVKNDYNRNRVFISLLQSGVYGSVRELTAVFEKSMTYFLDIKNVDDRMTALNNILEEEHSRRTLQLQNFLSIAGLIFAVIFGLPAINETLSYIRNLCFFIKQDIPIISVENCSFVIWCLTIFYLSLFIFRKSRMKRIDK